MEGISDGQIIAFTSLPVLDTPSHDTVFWLKLCVCAIVCRLLLRVRSRLRSTERLFPALLPEEANMSPPLCLVRFFSLVVYTVLL